MSNDTLLLSQFKKEVLDLGKEGTLPCNLTDKWLDILILQAEDLFSQKGDSENTILFSAVLHILITKYSKNEISISIEIEEVYKYMQRYQIELAIEELSRTTNKKFPKATFENIFTDRCIGELIHQ